MGKTNARTALLCERNKKNNILIIEIETENLNHRNLNTFLRTLNYNIKINNILVNTCIKKKLLGMKIFPICECQHCSLLVKL